MRHEIVIKALAGSGVILAVGLTRRRLGEDRGARRHRHHVRAIRRSLQGRGAGPQDVHRVVRASLCEAQRQVAVPLPSHG